jgi:hypothetical protein
MTSDYIITTMILDSIIACDNVDAFVILLVALMTASFLMWRKERLWNFAILRGVNHSNCIIPVRSEVLKVLKMTMLFFWDLTPRIPVSRHQLFRETYCLSMQS